MEQRIVIHGQTRSKKNSKRIIGRGKRKWIASSLIFSKWEKAALTELEKMQVKPWEGNYPLLLKFFFFRENKRQFDFSNMVEGVQDVLQKKKIILQDDMKHVVPVIVGWAISKKNPRVIVMLEDTDMTVFREDLNEL